jgi:Uma2 family endonuclease
MSQAAVARRRLTREDYRALPEGPPYYELIDGELVEMTRARRPHYRVTGGLSYLWEAAIRSGMGGELAQEPNLYLPGIEDVYHPDLVYLRAERLRLCNDEGIEGTPDVICEVLSPTTEKLDRHVKMEDFRRASVPHVWLVDPEQPVTVEEYVLEPHGRYRLNAIVRAPDEFAPVAFPGWKIPLSELDAAVTRAEDAAPKEPSSSPQAD